jgi:hypothetical protein
MDSGGKPLHEIRFGYLPTSPLVNGWQPLSAGENAQFDIASDIRNGLSMKADPDKFGMDYILPENARSAHFIQFEAKFGYGGRFYAQVLVNKPEGSGTEEWWLKHVSGDPAHEPDRLRGPEWRFYVAPLDGKKQFRLDLLDDIRRALPPGTAFVRGQRLRLRGNISLSSIRLSDTPLGFKAEPRRRLFKPLKDWGRTDKLALLGIVVAIVIGVSAFFVPEVRNFFGRDKPSTENHPLVAPVPVAPGPPTLIAETALNVREMRKQHHVSLISELESEKTTAELPPDSFGFASPVDLTLDRPAPLSSEGELRMFEVHKLHDNSLLVLGFVGQESFLKLREGVPSGEKIVLFSNAFKDVAKLVALPRNRIRCERIRYVEHHSILDCKIGD